MTQRNEAANASLPDGAPAPRPFLARWAPPLRQPQFWIVQLLVLVIAAGHALVETTAVVNLHDAAFVPVSLFLLPVIYAGLVFGGRGSAPTAIWCALLTMPNAFVWHEGTEVFGELWQAALVVAVGIFVGRRIDAERWARHEAERREREQRASEDKFRSVFDSAGDAIILLDPDGTVQEVNAAATRLLGQPADQLRHRSFSAIAPAQLSEVAASPTGTGVVGPITDPEGRQLWFVPVRTSLSDASGAALDLLLLRDVSLQVEHQQLLEGYGAKTLAAREEERRRIARELHDGPLQSVVLLWRRLDALELADPQLRDALAEASASAEVVAAELRRFSRDLRPSVLDDLGLPAALKAEVAAFESRTGLRGRFSSRGTTDGLGAHEQLAFLRVCQEALHNVERHAHASTTAVRLSVSATRAELVVEDDGRGMAGTPDPAELVRQGKLGVLGMQERARLIGGTCSVRGRRKGTLVRLTVPQAASS